MTAKVGIVVLNLRLVERFPRKIAAWSQYNLGGVANCNALDCRRSAHVELSAAQAEDHGGAIAGLKSLGVARTHGDCI